MPLLQATSRIALGARLHDLGKLKERAGVEHANRLDAHRTPCCHDAH